VCPQDSILVIELRNARTYCVGALLFGSSESGCLKLLVLVGDK
jgi:hypothetical protein